MLKKIWRAIWAAVRTCWYLSLAAVKKVWSKIWAAVRDRAICYLCYIGTYFVFFFTLHPQWLHFQHITGLRVPPIGKVLLIAISVVVFMLVAHLLELIFNSLIEKKKSKRELKDYLAALQSAAVILAIIGGGFFALRDYANKQRAIMRADFESYEIHRVNADYDSSDFSMSDFKKTELTPKDLYNSVTADLPEIKKMLSADQGSIDWLNKLMRYPDFLNKIIARRHIDTLCSGVEKNGNADTFCSSVEKNEVGKHEAGKCVEKKICALWYDYKKSSNEKRLMKLNRFLLEVFYPHVTPQHYFIRIRARLINDGYGDIDIKILNDLPRLTIARMKNGSPDHHEQQCKVLFDSPFPIKLRSGISMVLSALCSVKTDGFYELSFEAPLWPDKYKESLLSKIFFPSEDDKGTVEKKWGDRLIIRVDRSRIGETWLNPLLTGGRTVVSPSMVETLTVTGPSRQ
jgi:hypothetical protein